ncbi:MAG: hypothetical protein AAF242_02725 [Bacteroidota bacterium]
MGDILTGVVQDGVRINHAIDVKSSAIIAGIFFVATMLALVIYAKVIK